MAQPYFLSMGLALTKPTGRKFSTLFLTDTQTNHYTLSEEETSAPAFFKVNLYPPLEGYADDFNGLMHELHVEQVKLVSPFCRGKDRIVGKPKIPAPYR